MSDETDLDWLARNVHVWPEGKCDVLVLYPRNVNTLIWSSVSSDSGWITKDQWLARRAELQNKPSWGEFRESAIYMAQDSNGAWRAFECEPTPNSHMWNAKHGWRGYKNIDEPDSWRGEVLGDWRDTLEKRPEQDEFETFASIEDNQDQDMTQQHEVKQDSGWFERGELPPVGTRCVALLGVAPKANCEVIAKTEQQMVVKWEENGMMDVIDLDVHVAFRPIRTEREVLIEIIKKTDDTDDKIADAILAAGFKRGAA